MGTLFHLLLAASLAGSPAHAESEATTREAALTPGPQVRLADHEGQWTADGVAWSSRMLLDGQPQGGAEVHFAWPLHGQPSSPDVRRWIENADGHVVGAELEAGDAWILMEVQQPSEAGQPPSPLRPPALEGPGVQRVLVSELLYRPSPGLDLEARLQATVHAAISRQERRAADKDLDGRRSHARDHPIYFVVDGPLRQAGGLGGEVSLRGAVGPQVLLASSGAFALVLVGLLGVGRFLGKRVQAEEIDAYIAREFVATSTPKGGAPQTTPPPRDTGPAGAEGGESGAPADA